MIGKIAKTVIMLLAAGMLCLTGCSGDRQEPEMPGPDSQENVYQGKIIESKGDILLLSGVSEISASLVTLSVKETLVTDQNGKKTEASGLKNGMVIDVVMGEDASIAESYPGQIHGQKEIRIVDQENDITGMYLEALKEIYQIDPGLNSGVKIMVLDLSMSVNMSEAEKSALAYRWDSWLRSQSQDMDVYQKTYDELVEEGMIDTEKLYFPEGMLITIEDKEIKGDSFVFSISKWCSGLGADGLDNCKAVFEDGIGTYTKGTAWIS
ncbi:hypothetical protein [Lactonifactor longoviformis]|uniref:hypothetical protein n=1 Tax=Lactonifactor longoviformis TaxID=341220 RepID=UPI0036F19AF5